MLKVWRNDQIGDEFFGTSWLHDAEEEEMWDGGMARVRKSSRVEGATHKNLWAGAAHIGTSKDTPWPLGFLDTTMRAIKRTSSDYHKPCIRRKLS